MLGPEERGLALDGGDGGDARQARGDEEEQQLGGRRGRRGGRTPFPPCPCPGPVLGVSLDAANPGDGWHIGTPSAPCFGSASKRIPAVKAAPEDILAANILRHGSRALAPQCHGIVQPGAMAGLNWLVANTGPIRAHVCASKCRARRANWCTYASGARRGARRYHHDHDDSRAHVRTSTCLCRAHVGPVACRPGASACARREWQCSTKHAVARNGPNQFRCEASVKQ